MASGARLREPPGFRSPTDLSRGGSATAPFDSILSARGEGPPVHLGAELPAFIADLHLDDIVAVLATNGNAPEVAPLFLTPCRDVADIAYRHEVFQDLEQPPVLDSIRSFVRQMQSVRRRLDHASKTTYVLDQERWLLGAAEAFERAVDELTRELAGCTLRSSGLRAFHDHLAAYTSSTAYETLAADTRAVADALSRVRYRLRIHGLKVTISPFRAEPDYGAEVLQTFEQFRQGAPNHYEWRFEHGADMNHVEAAILERVARLEPDAFAALHDYAARHQAFLDPTIERFDREVQFYLAWLEYTDRIRRATGLSFCYPEVGAGPQRFEARRVFDLALATSLLQEGRPVVPNDVSLDAGERIVVVTGPNQGGKTTLARAIGQVYHLARIGVPVPGERVRLALVDAIFTHFERQEQIDDLTSKLEDDLRRIRALLEAATPASLVIMNESFSSTTVADQLVIGRRLVGQLLERGPLCVIVTFLDELATLDASIVSMVGTVDPDEPARRTFEIVRRAPDGLAYAMAIAERHGLTYGALAERLDA